MNAPKDFLQSLAAGDLVAATYASSTKLHLIHVVRPVTADMCKGEPSASALQQMFEGRPLCEVRPRYWWHPTDKMETYAAEHQCRYCFSRWRSGGRPTIKGWAKAEAPVESKVRLPFGWHEVTASGHPLDLADDAPDPDPDEDENKVGWKRKEVCRWIRGNRYVRITQEKDGRFCVHYGDLNDEPTEERWNRKAGWESVLIRAVVIMSLGGSWTSKTADRLTMADVTA